MTILIEHGPDRPRVYAFREDGRRTFPHVPLAQRLPYVLGRMEPNFPLPVVIPQAKAKPMASYYNVFSSTLPFGMGHHVLELAMREHLHEALSAGQRMCVFLTPEAFAPGKPPSINTVRGSYMIIQMAHRVVYCPGGGKPDEVWKNH